MANTYVAIAKNVLTSDAASVTFSSIPQTYTDLVLIYSTRINYSEASRLELPVYVRFNGDTATNYSARTITGSGSAASSFALSSSTNSTLYQAPDNGNTASTFGNAEYYIPNYTNSLNKPVGGTGVSENNNATAYQSGTASLWRGTAAITTILIRGVVGDLMSGSRFDLYGIKNS